MSKSMGISKINRLLANITASISLKLYYRLSYLHNRRKRLHLKNPTNLSEFIISQIVSRETGEYAIYADKYRVRNLVAERGLEHILTKLYGHWTNANKIDFDTLPNQFVLKQNAGCGLNIICFNKKELDIPETIETLNKWMQIKHFTTTEPHYDKIEKCIICEELISDGRYTLPTDYKFMCINGKPHHILVVSEREDESYKLYTYSLNWEKLQLLNEDYIHNNEIPRPENLNKMVEYATTLAQGFPFVRVDLYDTGDRVFFGELTFTPHGGLLRYYTIEALEEMWKKI